jgi:hypothetical protein
MYCFTPVILIFEGMKSPGILTICTFLLLFSCRKDSFISSPDARVRITSDTLKYDTVFVSAGSTYQTFKVINENDQKLRLTSIKLMGGNSSVYKINVDGTPGIQFDNIELEPNDSVYVFAQVNIDPSAANLPFILRDSIEVSYNGRKRYVQLEAWGQNAHFFRDKVITTNETWNNDLPYVILGSLFVNTNQKLTINKGCRIYVHADAPIVVNGTIEVNGSKDSIDRVYFQGDRLDEPYREFPASWPGLIFQTSSRDNIFNYAVIKNAFQAIALSDPSLNANPKMVLNECIIDNIYQQGIVAINSSLRARNCLISNCGNNLALVKGGNYQFTHCTIATYGNRYIDHRNPVLILTDYVVVNNQPVTQPLTATFTNCIFWGENGLVDNEVFVDKKGNSFNVSFNNALWKQQAAPANIVATGIISNQPPQFDSINTFKNFYNFRLKLNSPAANKGINAGVIIDLDGKPRPLGLPDLGSYESQ